MLNGLRRCAVSANSTARPKAVWADCGRSPPGGQRRAFPASARGYLAKDGRHQLKVLPEYDEFVRGLRVGCDFDVNILHGNYVMNHKVSRPDRAVELLQHAAWWTDGIFAEIAAMALGLWKQVTQRTVLRTVEDVLARHENCYEALIGLLIMAYRYTSDPSFPPALIQPLEDCLLAFSL